MKAALDIAAFVGLGIWLWFLIAILFVQAIAGLIAFQSQF